MDNTVKTLIIVVVVLVAALGIVGGFFLNNYLANSVNNNNPNHPIFNVTLNKSNSSQLNSTNSTSTPQITTGNNSGNNNYPISESQALQIVQANAGNQNYIYDGIKGEGTGAYYQFTVYLNTNIYGQEQFDWYEVNAYTGAMS